MLGGRWVVGIGAVVVAVTALFVLLNSDNGDTSGDRPRGNEAGSELAQPALDDIDAKSRAAMRDLLRKNE